MHNDTRSPSALQDISSAGLQAVLDGMYKGKVELSERNLVDTVSAAHHLQHLALLSVCEKFICETLTSDNCMNRRSVAESFDMSEVVKKIDSYVLAQFKDFSRGEGFLQLATQDLCRYLRSDALLCAEVEVFEAMKRWLQHDESRQEDRSEVAQWLRYGLIDLGKLEDVAEVLPSLQKAVEELCESSQDSDAAPMSRFLRGSEAPFRPRGCRTYGLLTREKSSLTVYRNTGDSDTLCFLRETEAEDGQTDFVGWEDIPRAAYLDRSVHSFVFNDFWFVFGVDSDNYSYTFHCFDARGQKWIPCDAPVSVLAAVGTYGFLVDKRIVVGGGSLVSSSHDDKDLPPELTSSVYSFDLRTAEWTESNWDDVFVWNAASCTFRGKGYVIGGHTAAADVDADEDVQADSIFDGYAYTKEVFAYTPSRPFWHRRAPLNLARCDASAGVLDDTLLVVGGLTRDTTSNYSLGKGCEAYNPTTNQWTFVCCENPSLREGLVVPTPVGFGIIQGNTFPLQYYEKDSDSGEIRSCKKLVEAALRWFPGRDHWSYIRGSIVTVAAFTTLPRDKPSRPYKPMTSGFSLVSRR